MNKIKHSPCISWIVFACLVVALCGGTVFDNRAGAQTQNPTHISALDKTKVASDLRAFAESPQSGKEIVKVILQLRDTPTVQLRTLLNRNDISVKKDFATLGSKVVELPANAVAVSHATR